MAASSSKKTCRTRVVNVKVEFLRPDWENLADWCDDPRNVYIGRAGVVFVPPSHGAGKLQRFPSKASIWANPFTVEAYGRQLAISLYECHIREMVKDQPDVYDLESLRGKRLGCWCAPEACHGDVLVQMLKEKTKGKKRKNF